MKRILIAIALFSTAFLGAEQFEWISVVDSPAPELTRCIFYDALSDEVYIDVPRHYNILSCVNFDQPCAITHWHSLPPKPYMVVSELELE